ncbi:MAG: methionine biosynthesis protein MetW [bacterium]
MSARFDLDMIQQWVAPESRVLDLACGDGVLLKSLKENRKVEGYGLEISPEQITACIEKGVNVIETDIDTGLKDFGSKSFDTVIMTQALQVMRHPHIVVEEMLRIGRECIVTFPNFGNWRSRLYLTFRGMMPKTRQLSYEWYDTPNIHFCTVRDFEALCREMNIQVIHRAFISERNLDRQIKGLWPNMFSETAVYHLRSSDD